MKLMSTGRGPTDAEIAANERKKQEREAEGWAQIVTNREALKMQIEAEENPDHFIPGSSATHKPPKDVKRHTRLICRSNWKREGKRQRKRKRKRKIKLK